MQVFHFEPTGVDTKLQQFVRRAVSGQATAEEIEQARQQAGLSPLECLLLAEAIERQSVTFIGDVLHPLCG